MADWLGVGTVPVGVGTVLFAERPSPVGAGGL